MTTKTWRTLIYLSWLSLPFVLISHLVLWNRLPAKMAVHFGFGGAPDGWMSREGNLAFSLIALLLILLISTVKLRYKRKRIHQTRPKDMLRHYLSVGALTIIVMGVLIYNIWR